MSVLLNALAIRKNGQFLLFFGLIFQVMPLPFLRAEEAPIETTQTQAQPVARESVLDDPLDRISAEFSVPAALKGRTAFWFDIYTIYGSSDHVLHHADFPWIIFKVVNTSKIENNPALHKWTKYHESKSYVRSESRKIRKALINLSRRSNFKKLSPLEKALSEQLAAVPGKRQRVYKQAALSLRSQLGQKDFFISGLHYSAKYLPLIEEKFLAAGLPTELTRIPFVESSFNVNAQSKVGASGIWQIMPVIGKAYVSVNDHVDERNSPLKASYVAIALMQHNYRALGKWPLAVTAYNHGASGVKKAMVRLRTDDIGKIIGRYKSPSFQFASSNFYASFLAALHAQKYHKEILPDVIQANEVPLDYFVVALRRPARVRQILKSTQMSEEQFLVYNLDLKRALKNNARIPAGHRLILPKELMPALQSQFPQKKTLFREAALSGLLKTSS